MTRSVVLHCFTTWNNTRKNNKILQNITKRGTSVKEGVRKKYLVSFDHFWSILLLMRLLTIIVMNFIYYYLSLSKKKVYQQPKKQSTN